MIESNRNRDLERKIELYVEGRLSPQEVDDLWAELIDNEYYHDYLKSAVNLKKVADEKEEDTGSDNFGSNRQVWLSAAAAILLMVGAATIFNLSTGSNEMVEPVASIELDYYRSADGSATESVDSEVVRQAISAANMGEVTEALELLKNELETTNSDHERAELLVTSGSILYNSGQFKDAIKQFEAALELEYDDLILRERNYWYLGNAYFQINRLTEAKDTLEKAFELNGAYSRVAQSYIRALSAR